MAMVAPGLPIVDGVSAALTGRERGRAPPVVLLLGSLMLMGCGPRAARVGPGPQAYYRTGFPLADISGDLEEILPSVVRIQIQAFYDTYVFDVTDAPTDEELLLGAGDILSRAVDTGTASTTQAATAIVIASSRGRGTLVTTDHGINLPDTTLDYFGADVPRRGGSPAVERLSIKRRQLNTVIGASFVEPFEVLARSAQSDLALIGVELPPRTDSIPRLEVIAGTPRRLSWGSMVYIVGHPAGYQMVTRAIVSKLGQGSSEEFLTDGLLNEGTSGAPILAVRGDTDELEWVGIARAASARTERRLVPPAGAERTQEPGQLYDGPIYLRQVEEIRYGITFSIPISEFRDFLEDQRARLRAARYPVPEL